MTKGLAIDQFVIKLNRVIQFSYTPFTRSSKHRTIIEQSSSKCIQNTRARRVL